MAGGHKKIHEHPNANTNGFDKRPQDAVNGGRPLKIYNHIKNLGYSKDDLRACFGEVVFYTKNELIELLADEKQPAIALIVARSILEGIQNGDMSKVKDILEHTIGKPTQTTNEIGNKSVNINLNEIIK